MGLVTALFTEIRDDRLLQLVAAVVVILAIVGALAPAERRRLRGPVVLFALYLLLVPIAALLRAHGAFVYRETRLTALIFATLAMIFMTASFLFGVVTPRLRLRTSRILQDVIIAGSSIIAIFVLASRAGLNLSGLIATSAVLTAVIGLAFQDTLGNIVGGLALELDNSIRVGDWIKVGDLNGRVTDIRWRYTAIETRNWETVIVPNSQLVKNQVLVLGRRHGQPVLWRRWVYFNVDFRYPPSDVIDTVLGALRDTEIENVATKPPPNCILFDLHESYARYAVRYWLEDLAVDDPTDSVVRTRIYFALKRVGIPLSIPAHAIFMTEESEERREHKTREDTTRRIGALSRVDLFTGISSDERSLLAASLRHAPFTKGETITRQGSVAHWLYMIVNGEAAVRVAADGGIDREVARLKPGDFFGEMSLLTGERRSATVVALTDVDCYRLDHSAFKALLERRPEIAEHVADVLAKRRVELVAVKENLDLAAQRERLRTTRIDLLSRIRNFFADDEARPSIM